jgi:hypothetical protein
VRDEAPKLAARATDERVRAAANDLRARLEPDPLSKALLALTLVLLAGLSAWWCTHDGRAESAPIKPAPTIERVPDSFGTSR